MMGFTDEQKKMLEERSVPEPNSGCLIWLGPVNSKGYGQINSSYTTIKVHRLAYSAKNGPIPSGLTIDHLCKVTCCINPNHLEAVTIVENVKRSSVGRKMAERTHCNHGHSFAEHGWLKKSNGYRRCAECERARSLAYSRKKRASA